MDKKENKKATRRLYHTLRQIVHHIPRWQIVKWRGAVGEAAKIAFRPVKSGVCAYFGRSLRAD